jgi:hypothetical protein
MSFLETIKKLFKDKSQSISIEEATDETDYLLSSPKNKNRLQESIQQVKNGETIDVKNTTNLKKKLRN